MSIFSDEQQARINNLTLERDQLLVQVLRYTEIIKQQEAAIKELNLRVSCLADNERYAKYGPVR